MREGEREEFQRVSEELGGDLMNTQNLNQWENENGGEGEGFLGHGYSTGLTADEIDALIETGMRLLAEQETEGPPTPNVTADHVLVDAEVGGKGNGRAKPRSRAKPSDHMSPDHTPRLKWTRELHGLFLEAVEQLGGPHKATPKALLKIMQIQNLSVYNVKSRLQKLRQGKASFMDYDEEPIKGGASVLQVSGGPRITNSSNAPPSKMNGDNKRKRTEKAKREGRGEIYEKIQAAKNMQRCQEEQQRYLETAYMRFADYYGGGAAAHSTWTFQQDGNGYNNQQYSYPTYNPNYAMEVTLNGEEQRPGFQPWSTCDFAYGRFPTPYGPATSSNGNFLNSASHLTTASHLSTGVFPQHYYGTSSSSTGNVPNSHKHPPNAYYSSTGGFPQPYGASSSSTGSFLNSHGQPPSGPYFATGVSATPYGPSMPSTEGFQNYHIYSTSASYFATGEVLTPYGPSTSSSSGILNSDEQLTISFLGSYAAMDGDNTTSTVEEDPVDTYLLWDNIETITEDDGIVYTKPNADAGHS